MAKKPIRSLRPPLAIQILIAITCGILAGILLGPDASRLSWIGDLFIRLIRMAVVPLVLVMIIDGIARLGDIRTLGSIGGRVVAFITIMVTLAVINGLLVGAILKPGSAVALAASESDQAPDKLDIMQILVGLIPANPFEALAQGNMLSIIVFAGIVGVGVVLAGKSARPVAALAEAGTAVLLEIVRLIMLISPIGVFALVASAVGTLGFGVLAGFALLALGLVIAIVVQVAFFQWGLVRVIGSLSLKPFIRTIAAPALIAFSTSSSAATLPASLAAGRKLGLSEAMVSTAIPLGANIAREGSAIYVALLTMLAVQALGLELGWTDYLTLVPVAVLAAMGAAAVPSGALFTVAAVLQLAGISDVQAAALVALIFPIDRMLDMLRTSANVTGNLAVTLVAGRLAGELDCSLYQAPDVRP